MNINRRLIAASMTALLPVGMATAIAVSAMTYDAPLAGFVGTQGSGDAVADSKPINLPTWDDHKTDPALDGCRAKKTADELADMLAVVKMDGHAYQMTFDEAVERNTNPYDGTPVWDGGYQPYGADDVFVIGICS